MEQRELVNRVVEEAAPLAQANEVQVKVVAPRERCTAEIDERRIERVLRNLVVNAVEHAEGSPVEVCVASNDTMTAVRVLDHGVGMSEQTCKQVFERFFRADPARTRTTGGTGLGLSIAREDVALHQGRISAWGKLGVGSSFLVELPRRAGQALGESPLQLWPEGSDEDNAGGTVVTARPAPGALQADPPTVLVNEETIADEEGDEDT